MAILNRNRVSVPDMDGTGMVEYLRLIKIDPESGWFSATVPEHLRDIARLVAPEQKIEEEDGFKHTQPNLNYYDTGKFAGEVVGITREMVVERWKSLIYRCKEFLTTQAKVKVILLTTEMNVTIYGKDKRLLLSRGDISFAKTEPLIGVSYKICFQAGKHLVDKNNKYIGEGKGSVIIPHTPDREAFLKNIVDTFEKAALQLNDFMSLVKADPLQIEGVMKRGFLLGYKSDDKLTYATKKTKT